ncbi:MAG TPA: response regulator, partial [Ktedonobacteraceae bacterium]|nr:response regulator [Ktedonobacteraceae bacterium]
ALRETPHLIIVDIMLPDIDGFEVIQRLRDHPKTMHIPIIVLSALGEPEDKMRAYEKDVDGYITKPFNTDELLARVRRQLRRGQQNYLSPLTSLPGGIQVVRAINCKLHEADPWSLLYLDLDNFKAFNDVYGFLAGNEMIILVGNICQRVVYEFGNTDDFVGHIGGDDFAIVTTPDRSTLLCRHIVARYKEQSAGLYHSEDLERGSISGLDRKGRPYQFPLVSLSIGVVNNQTRKPRSIQEVSYLAAEAKRHAKQSNENVFSISSQHEKVHPDLNHIIYSPSYSQVASAYSPFSLDHCYYDPLHFLGEKLLAEFEQQVY